MTENEQTLIAEIEKIRMLIKEYKEAEEEVFKNGELTTKRLVAEYKKAKKALFAEAAQ